MTCGRPAAPVCPDMPPMLMMEPAPLSRSARSAALMVRKAPSRMMPVTYFQVA
jgi:hypothetical protein